MFMQAMQSNDALTANGAVTHSTTSNAILDLFFIAGATRTISEGGIKDLLIKAFAENQLLALKVVFWAGDIRGGAGERRFFKIALAFIKTHYPSIFSKNFKLVPEYNRWDSLFDFTDIEVLTEINKNVWTNALLAKWMPREGKAKHQAFRKAFMQAFKLSAPTYRKMLSRVETTETLLSERRYNSIKYDNVPSVAFKKYTKAFAKRDSERFVSFLEAVKKGEKKINAGAIFPHDIVKALDAGCDQTVTEALNQQWKQLPNYVDSDSSILPVCDVSGSMSGLPMEISLALGVYLSERNKSVFKDIVVTFHSNPTFFDLSSYTSLSDKIEHLRNAPWGMNTDLRKTFQIILSRARAAHLPAADMPKTVLIISDMEFDSAGSQTNFQTISQSYEQFGYQMPQLVFWNVHGSAGNCPVKHNQSGVALVSGASPTIIKSILGGDLSPVKIMLKTIDSERYTPLTV